MNERLRDSYEALLLAYVAGALDAAQNLAVAAHAALSLNARMRIAQLEALGGALLCQGCEPHNMSEGALDKVLGKLDACCGEEGKEGPRGRLREVEHRLLMPQNGLEEAAAVGFAGDFLDEVRSVEQFLHQRFLKLLGEHDVVEPSLPDIVRHPCFRRLPEVVFKGKQRCSHGRKLRGFTAFPMVGSAGRTVQRLIQY